MISECLIFENMTNASGTEKRKSRSNTNKKHQNHIKKENFNLKQLRIS